MPLNYSDIPQYVQNLMITFNINPTSEIFNRIILSDKPLYQGDETDTTDELYVEYENENWQERIKRIKQAEEQIKSRAGTVQGSHRANFCHPVILSWVYASVRQFPWLYDECVRPLYIERAYKFNDNTYYKIQRKVFAGPIYKEPQDLDSIEDEIERENIHRYDVKPYDLALDTWKETCKEFIELTFIRFGASGNKWYIEHAKNIAGVLGEEQFNQEKQNMSHYDDFVPREDIDIDDIQNQALKNMPMGNDDLDILAELNDDLDILAEL